MEWKWLPLYGYCAPGIIERAEFQNIAILSIILPYLSPPLSTSSSSIPNQMEYRTERLINNYYTRDRFTFQQMDEWLPVGGCLMGGCSMFLLIAGGVVGVGERMNEMNYM